MSELYQVYGEDSWKDLQEFSYHKILSVALVINFLQAPPPNQEKNFSKLRFTVFVGKGGGG